MMNHNPTEILGSLAEPRNAWLDESKSLILRALGSREAYKNIGLDLLIDHIQDHLRQSSDHSWSSTNNALLALLSGQRQFVNFQAPKEKEHWPLAPDVILGARRLVDLGYDPTQKSSILGGVDALDYALMLNAPALVAEWSEGVDLSKRTIKGVSWLHAAAQCGMREMCRLLVSLGMDINGRDSAGNTPLFYAPNSGTIEYLRVLGADTSLRNDQKIDALTFIRGRNKDLKGEKLQSFALAMGGVQGSDDLSASIAQFEALVGYSSAQALKDEVVSLGLPPSVRFSNGNTILGQAMERYLPNFNYNRASRDRQKAVAWLSFCVQWEGVLEHATPQDLALLCVLGDGTGHTIKWSTPARAALALRGLDDTSFFRGAAEQVLHSLVDYSTAHPRERVPKCDQVESLMDHLLEGGQDTDVSLVNWGLKALVDDSSVAGSAIAAHLARHPPQWDGWSNQELALYLGCNALFYDLAGLHHAPEYAALVERCIERAPDKGVLLENLTGLLSDYPNAPGNSTLAAHIQNAVLTLQTPSVSQHRPSLRL